MFRRGQFKRIKEKNVRERESERGRIRKKKNLNYLVVTMCNNFISPFDIHSSTGQQKEMRKTKEERTSSNKTSYNTLTFFSLC